VAFSGLLELLSLITALSATKSFSSSMAYWCHIFDHGFISLDSFLRFNGFLGLKSAIIFDHGSASTAVSGPMVSLSLIKA